MESINLNADMRGTRGNSPARALRRSGRIPAVIYGPGTEPLAISIDTHEIRTALRDVSGSNFFVNLTVAGDAKTERTTMVKEIQVEPLSRELLHADFYEVPMDRKIHAMVPVHLVGKCIGVEMGGVLSLIRRELEVICLPTLIPDNIEIDVTDLDIGHSVHVNDVELEGDVEIPDDVNFTVVTVVAAKQVEEEVEEEEGEELEEGAEAEEDAPSEDAE